MTTEQIIFFLALLYLSLVVGIFIKFRLIGVSGKWLLFSGIAPIMMLVVSPAAAFRSTFLTTNGSLLERVITAFDCALTAYKYFPIFVALVGEKLTESTRRKAKKKIHIIDIARPSYNGLYSLRGMAKIRLKT